MIGKGYNNVIWTNIAISITFKLKHNFKALSVTLSNISKRADSRIPGTNPRWKKTAEYCEAPYACCSMY